MTFSTIKIQGQVSPSIEEGDDFDISSDTLYCDRVEGEQTLLFDCHIPGMTQVNTGNATGFQTVVSGGSVAFVGMSGGNVLPSRPPSVTLTVPAGWDGEIVIAKNSVVASNKSKARIL